MKPGTFTQLLIHIVFAVKHRECLLTPQQRTLVFSYVSGIVSNLNHKSIIVNGFSDHIHILLGQNPSSSISNIVSEVKKASSGYINNMKWFPGTFQWQDGYGAFSYSKSQLNNIYNYISNQENHHKVHKFSDEYLDILHKFEIEFNEHYLFEFYNQVEV